MANVNWLKGYMAKRAKRRSKYGNIRVTIGETSFASRREADVYLKLKCLQKAGEVKAFGLQHPFRFELNGVLICKYVADFVVYWKDGHIEVWDAKGFKTDVYVIKKKMLKAFTGYDIVEV